MSKIPVKIEIPIFGETFCYEGFSSIPVLDVHVNVVDMGTGFMQYTRGREEWGEIELEFTDSINHNQAQHLLDWLYSSFSHYAEKRTIKLNNLRDHNSGFALIGAFPSSFEQKVDHNCSRNERKLTRKVLIEKNGNETIEIYLNVSLKVDRVIVNP